MFIKKSAKKMLFDFKNDSNITFILAIQTT